MKLHLYTCLLLCFLFFNAAAQSTLSGIVTDIETGEPLIGATVVSGSNGTVTDWDGSYSLKLNDGLHTINVSYVSFKTEKFEIEIKGDMVRDFKLNPDNNVLEEITVTADIAIERETPVAFSNIPTRKLNEELAAQDIPMILNSTPGVYATETGGGDGDARITIRGFNQRNVAVMLDGIPVNDMENGWVYWSNWFGLDLVTQTMQVQRGLGASKLSSPSIGGTVNILTKGIDSKRGLKFRQEIGNNGFLRSTLGLTSGRLKNGWGISAAASYKQGDGWVDGNYTQGYFYYLRIDKQLGNHLVSLAGFGAPQKHGRREFPTDIAVTDTTYAKEIGVDPAVFEKQPQLNRGRRYSSFWGYRDGELYNLRENYYHKPQFNLRHSWQVNDKLFWSNIAYLSIGNGGGSNRAGEIPQTEDGALDFDAAIEANQPTFFNPEGISNNILFSNVNNHYWYGFLSTMRYNINDFFTLSGGLDGRYYRGDHYRVIDDLLGGNYYGTPDNKLYVGDRIVFDNSGFVRMGGIFGLLEFKRNRFSAFLNASTSTTGYDVQDFMRNKEITLPDTSFLIGATDTIIYNDKAYTENSPEADFQRLGWVDQLGYTLKTGAAFNINKNHSVFFNTGYLSRPQNFNNTISSRFGDRVKKFQEVENELVTAFELGYGFKSSIFSANVNTYYTSWRNKPVDRPPSVLENPDDPLSDRIPLNILGINALHKGIEIDFVFKPMKNLSIEGLASIGDWKWTSEAEVIVVSQEDRNFSFDATGVKVGDAAQLQFGGMIRYEPIKGLYVKLKSTYFGNNYAAFQPEDLQDENERRQSWKMPNYNLVSAHAGYGFKIKKIRLNLRANVLNLLDEVYISDARNNDPNSNGQRETFDATSATVFFGQGRRWSTSLQISF